MALHHALCNAKGGVHPTGYMQHWSAVELSSSSSLDVQLKRLYFPIAMQSSYISTGLREGSLDMIASSAYSRAQEVRCFLALTIDLYHSVATHFDCESQPMSYEAFSIIAVHKRQLLQVVHAHHLSHGLSSAKLQNTLR